MNAVAPTMLSSSNVPQPEFACWWPSSPRDGEQRRVLRQRLAVHDQVLPVHVHLDVVVAALAAARGSRSSVIPMFRIMIFIAGSEFLCSSQSSWPRLAELPGDLPEPVDEQVPALRVGRLERVVVALDPGPDDHRHAELPGELRAGDRDLHRLGAHRRVGIAEAAAPEARVEVEPAGEAVDVVVRPERVADRRRRSARSAPAGSGTRSRRSGRRARRPRGGHARPSSRPRARAGSRPERTG